MFQCWYLIHNEVNAQYCRKKGMLLINVFFSSPPHFSVSDHLSRKVFENRKIEEFLGPQNQTRIFQITILSWPEFSDSFRTPSCDNHATAVAGGGHAARSTVRESASSGFPLLPCTTIGRGVRRTGVPQPTIRQCRPSTSI